MTGADGISGGGRSGGPSGGGSGPPLEPEDIERIRQTIRESIEELTRFEDLMRGFLASGIAQNLSNDIGGKDADDRKPPIDISDGLPPPNPYAQAESVRSFLAGTNKLPDLHPVGVGEALASAAAALTAQPGFISRQGIDELLRRYGPQQAAAAPTVEVSMPNLSVVGGRLASSTVAANTMPVLISDDLRLMLSSVSKWVGIERRVGDEWLPTQVMAMKDGKGGVEIDVEGLEQEIGALPQDLRIALNLEAKPEVPPPRGHKPDQDLLGILSGPLRPDPKGKADFIDAFGQPWLVISFEEAANHGTSDFDLDRIIDNFSKKLRSGLKLIIDTRTLAEGYDEALRTAVSSMGWHEMLRFWM
ncbi:hypothetical protein [Paracoccus sulfuroxidans]|uniref:Uncharacterized protein n=1 Tax=Paracoccus sulfuroxidans TaxID=384678 RepID=A0A562NMQ0_9RHOB|nr:hypothetical protein [Paracoccus sulfuroxidans]TWI33271.1 hypothetical protein IQ24_02412 [Paracoccus sulfuroxidans]